MPRAKTRKISTVKRKYIVPPTRIRMRVDLSFSLVSVDHLESGTVSVEYALHGQSEGRFLVWAEVNLSEKDQQLNGLELKKLIGKKLVAMLLENGQCERRLRNAVDF